MTIMPTKSSGSDRRGFTLVEVMVSIGIFSIIIASILSTFLVFMKGSLSVGAYAEMSSQSRKALELFSRDVRAAESLTVKNALESGGEVYTVSGITLFYPEYYGSDREVSYEYVYDSVKKKYAFIRSVTYDGTTTSEDMFPRSDIPQLKIKFYQTPGSDFAAVPGPVASVDTWTKSMQLDAELIQQVGQTDNTDYIISARFMMRNYN